MVPSAELSKEVGACVATAVPVTCCCFLLPGSDSRADFSNMDIARLRLCRSCSDSRLSTDADVDPVVILGAWLVYSSGELLVLSLLDSFLRQRGGEGTIVVGVSGEVLVMAGWSN